MHLNVGAANFKLLGEYIGENNHNLGIVSNLLDRTQKVVAMKE